MQLKGHRGLRQQEQFGGSFSITQNMRQLDYYFRFFSEYFRPLGRSLCCTVELSNSEGSPLGEQLLGKHFRKNQV